MTGRSRAISCSRGMHAYIATAAASHIASKIRPAATESRHALAFARLRGFCLGGTKPRPQFESDGPLGRPTFCGITVRECRRRAFADGEIGSKEGQRLG